MKIEVQGNVFDARDIVLIDEIRKIPISEERYFFTIYLTTANYNRQINCEHKNKTELETARQKVIGTWTSPHLITKIEL